MRLHSALRVPPSINVFFLSPFCFLVFFTLYHPVISLSFQSSLFSSFSHAAREPSLETIFACGLWPVHMQSIGFSYGKIIYVVVYVYLVLRINLDHSSFHIEWIIYFCTTTSTQLLVIKYFFLLLIELINQWFKLVLLVIILVLPMLQII